jgi:phosphoesterase RecJ-like protein
MTQPIPADILENIQKHNSFFLTTHVKPDGDAVGSVLALGLTLLSLGKQVKMVLQDPAPTYLHFLKDCQLIISPVEFHQLQKNGLQIDVAIILDTAAPDRAGMDVLSLLNTFPLTINIDHHGTNPNFGHLNWINPQSPATGQIIFDLMTALTPEIPPAALEAFYVAISTDTGSFQYRGVNAHTHQIIAKIHEAGIETHLINQKLYQTTSKKKMDLMKSMLNEMQYHENNQLITWLLSQTTIQQLQIQSGDSEGLIEFMRNIDTVKAAIFFQETPEGTLRTSMRSKDSRINVAALAANFGGGGHPAAAGVTLSPPNLKETQLKLIQHLCHEIRKLN